MLVYFRCLRLLSYVFWTLSITTDTGQSVWLPGNENCTLTSDCAAAIRNLGYALRQDVASINHTDFEEMCRALNENLPCFHDAFSRCPDQIHINYELYFAYKTGSGLNDFLCLNSGCETTKSAQEYSACHNAIMWEKCEYSSSLVNNDSATDYHCRRLIHRDTCYEDWLRNHCTPSALEFFHHIHRIYYNGMACSEVLAEPPMNSATSWYVVIVSGVMLVLTLLAIISIFCRCRQQNGVFC